MWILRGTTTGFYKYLLFLTPLRRLLKTTSCCRTRSKAPLLLSSWIKVGKQKAGLGSHFSGWRRLGRHQVWGSSPSSSASRWARSTATAHARRGALPVSPNATGTVSDPTRTSINAKADAKVSNEFWYRNAYGKASGGKKSRPRLCDALELAATAEIPVASSMCGQGVL